MMRAMAVLRERYGFTATESMDMTLEEFRDWLEALDESGDKNAEDGRERLVNVQSPGERIDPGRIRRIVQQLV